jgi:gas vesicle protein
MYELQQSSVDTASAAGRRGMSFAVGAIIGAGIALLLAPTPGRDMRQRLGTTARKVGTGAKDIIAKARGTMEGVREDARVAVDRGRESFTQARQPVTRPGFKTHAG